MNAKINIITMMGYDEKKIAAEKERFKKKKINPVLSLATI